MISRVMLALGSFRFSIDTAAYDSLARSTSWSWPSQARAGREPARQFTGRGDDTITLAGVIFTEKAGLDQVKDLREVADEGEALVLIGENGNVHGWWCVENISETQSGFFSDGAPRKQEFTVQMAAYGEDG